MSKMHTGILIAVTLSALARSAGATEATFFLDRKMWAGQIPSPNEQYIERCRSVGVPIPPAWGAAGWIPNGILEEPFVQVGLEASVYLYHSSTPQGLCMALPRSEGSNIRFLGIICQGKKTGNACFWDNENVNEGDLVPLDAFSPGSDPTIEDCTDCHLGKNAFIIHPNTPLDLGSQLNSDHWYRPLGHESWPPNPGPTQVLHRTTLSGGDKSCLSCHTSDPLPQLSSETSKYCRNVLQRAMDRTMPPGNPSDPGFEKHEEALRAACRASPVDLCDPDNSRLCVNAEGYCEVAVDIYGHRHDLCRWPSKASASSCGATAGIWTSASSSFARDWPTAVPPGQSGACITQMRNVGGIRATGDICSADNANLCKKCGWVLRASVRPPGRPS